MVISFQSLQVQNTLADVRSIKKQGWSSLSERNRKKGLSHPTFVTFFFLLGLYPNRFLHMAPSNKLKLKRFLMLEINFILAMLVC